MGFKKGREWSADRRGARDHGVSVRIYREMKAAHLAGKDETPIRKFHDEGERLGRRKCCSVSCTQPSVYIQYFLDMPAAIVLCEKHAQSRLNAE